MKRYSNIIAIIVFLGYAFSCNPDIDTSASVKPEDYRFSKIVLAENLDQPMHMDFLKDGRILFVEREGAIKVFDPGTGLIKVIARIPVSSGYYNEDGTENSAVGEDGMQGVVLDPDWEQNHWIYLFYSPKEGNTGTVLTRYTWDGGDSLDLNSKLVLLEVPNQRISCCHLGGGMVFDGDGNLYVSTGDNSPNDLRGFNPIDERPGRSRFDSQRSSSNTNDLRGKILRIHPEADGTYTIPAGNLFPPGTPKTRPEIYTMGNRNPYRLSIDSKTGWLYWGEVGPAGSKDSVGFGPKSYEEFNMAKKAGNYGWPYLSGNNFAYWYYDYEKGQPGDQFNPERLINNSPNNTGLKELPPPVPALIWYPQAISEDFPIPGSGSASALGGPVFRKSDFDKHAHVFPPYYEGKWFITDWARGWIMVVEMDDNGKYVSMERFLPDEELIGPNDMKFGPDGSLYVLEYGRGPYIGNPEARLIKFQYNKGNLKPRVEASVNKTAGAAPLSIQLSSAGTIDYDHDDLSYRWEIRNQSADELIHVYQPDSTVILENPGVYEIKLFVDDGTGAVQSEPITVAVGNEPPVVLIDLQNSNQSFGFPGERIQYEVSIKDKEDGNTHDGDIGEGKVKMNIDFVKEDIAELVDLDRVLKNEDVLLPVELSVGRYLLNSNDCNICHRMDTKLMGPSFDDIGKKYGTKPDARAYLAGKIINGSVGIWGEEAMPPHPAITMKEAELIAGYLLQHRTGTTKSKPLKGSFVIDDVSKNDGRYILRASYLDRGNGVASPIETVEVKQLKSPKIGLVKADEISGFILKHHIGRKPTAGTSKGDGYFKFENIDLNRINALEVELNLAGIAENEKPEFELELYLDSLSGNPINRASDFIRRESKNKWDNRGIMRLDLDKSVVPPGEHDLYIKMESRGELKREYEFLNLSFLREYKIDCVNRLSSCI